MSLASHLQNILSQLQISDSDRAKYTSDAVAICNELMSDLQKADPNVRENFNGLNLAGSYLDRVKLKTPDEFDMQIKLKFPFQVTPERDNQRAGFVYLAAPAGNRHPAVENGYVNRESLQVWLRDAFRKVFQSYSRLNVNGEIYNLEYQQQGWGCAHTIVAKSTKREISFDFVPVFEFTYSKWPLPAPSVSREVRDYWPWFAVPQQKAPASDRTFMVCAPHWEREMMKGKDNLKNVLRLMKAMRDAHKDDMPHLSSYMLKTVILLELENAISNFWQRDLATIYIAMWTKLVQYLRNEELPFFLAKGCNHFDRLRYQNNLAKCKQTAVNLLQRLNSLGNYPSYSDVSKLFL